MMKSEQVHVLFFLFIMCMMGILSYVLFILEIYFSLAIGQLLKVAKYREIIAFGAFIVVNTIKFLIDSGINYITQPFIEDSFKLQSICGLSYLFILCVALFIGIKYILERHLNIE